jgi:hypothetical protein
MDHEPHIPVAEYEALAQQWDPVKFDAEAWVRLAKDVGMKYIVITSKHHEKAEPQVRELAPRCRSAVR